MNRKNRIIASAILLLGTASALWGQEWRTDTLRLNVYFPKNSTVIYPDFRDNGRSLEAFRAVLEYQLRDSATHIDNLVIRSSASPEGPYDNNVRLAKGRGESIGAWLEGTKGLDPSSIQYEYVPEDWDGLAAILPTIDQPWVNEALEIIENVPQWETVNGKEVESRKLRFKELRGGRPWAWLDTNVFPDLRAGGGSVSCVIWRPVASEKPHVPDTVFVDRPADTVFVAPAPEVPTYFSDGKKMILAVRTNVLAVPFANFGVEVPLGENWSIGADYYYPWLWRPLHKQGLDLNGRCFEMLAADLEARYWFPNTKKRPEQRLLGHSLGLYVAGGYYDFERGFTGHQGEFGNVGLDYLYACPIFKGRMHLEFELGVGYIYSQAQPYDTFVAGDKAYRRRGYTQITRWFGPTRAQFSLVVPIYVKTNKGGEL